jgi:molybdenum cofactor cytidylyltransferase
MKTGSKVAAILLAAGTSTRMGKVKQLLPIDGRPVLEHVLDNVRGADVSEIILVLGHSAEAIQQEVELRDVKVVMNDNYPQGMGTSLQAGLAAVDARIEAAIIVLADQPFVCPSTLDRLIREHSRTRAQIVIPTYRGFRGNPVLLDRSVFPEVMNLRGDIGCRAIFGDHLEGIVKVPVEDFGILLDLDEPVDYDKLRTARHGDKQVKPLPPSAHMEEFATPAPGPARPELVVVGRDRVVATLAKLARLLGFHLTLVDPLLSIREVPEADRILHVLDFSLLPADSDRHVVVASRGACDEEAVEQALEVNSAYVALVASKKRGEEVLRSLKMSGIPPERLARLRVPAGLEIGADTAEEIALSIMAEIVGERRKRLAAIGNPVAKPS